MTELGHLTILSSTSVTQRAQAAIFLRSGRPTSAKYAQLTRFKETAYAENTGPIGRLIVRGVATRTNQVMPFLTWYRSGPSDHLDPDQAVDQFLNLY